MAGTRPTMTRRRWGRDEETMWPRPQAIGLIGGDGNPAEAGSVSVGTDGGAELLENRAGQRVGAPVVFRVPLYADGIADRRAGFAGGDSDRLDQAVWRGALDDQAGRQLVDALVVQGVHRDLRRAGKAVQPAAG